MIIFKMPLIVLDYVLVAIISNRNFHPLSLTAIFEIFSISIERDSMADHN